METRGQSTEFNRINRLIGTGNEIGLFMSDRKGRTGIPKHGKLVMGTLDGKESQFSGMGQHVEFDDITSVGRDVCK